MKKSRIVRAVTVNVFLLSSSAVFAGDTISDAFEDTFGHDQIPNAFEDTFGHNKIPNAFNKAFGGGSSGAHRKTEKIHSPGSLPVR